MQDCTVGINMGEDSGVWVLILEWQQEYNYLEGSWGGKAVGIKGTEFRRGGSVLGRLQLCSHQYGGEGCRHQQEGGCPCTVCTQAGEVARR